MGFIAFLILGLIATLIVLSVWGLLTGRRGAAKEPR